MIYNTSNVASDTQIIEEFTDTRIHDVLSIDTDKLKYITERYNSLCTEMSNRGYVCNRVEQAELERGIDRSLFWDYKVTDAALALNRARISERLEDSKRKISERLADSAMKKLLKEKK